MLSAQEKRTWSEKTKLQKSTEIVQPNGESLSRATLFARLREAEREQLAKRLNWARYSAGEQIISHLDDSSDVFVVITGTVRVVIYSLTGREVTYRDIPAGKYFGELAAIDGLPRSASIVAMRDSLIASMSAETFWRIILDHPEVITCLVKDLTKSVRSLTERVFEFSALAVKNRIHAELLRLARAHMTGANEALIDPAPTHTEIASRISTRREAVARELSNLSRDGLLERRKGAWAIGDVERLACLVQEVVGH